MWLKQTRREASKPSLEELLSKLITNRQSQTDQMELRKEEKDLERQLSVHYGPTVLVYKNQAVEIMDLNQYNNKGCVVTAKIDQTIL